MDIRKITEAQYFLILGFMKNGFQYIVQTDTFQYLTLDEPPKDKNLAKWITDQPTNRIACIDNNATNFQYFMLDSKVANINDIVTFLEYYKDE